LEYIVPLTACIVGLFTNKLAVCGIIPNCAMMGIATRRQRSKDNARLKANHLFPSFEFPLVKNALIFG